MRTRQPVTTRESRLPSQLLYTMVRDRILADLASTGLQAGDRYFTEGQLMQRFDVSRNTVRRAMAELEQGGYIRRQRGLGSVVVRLPGTDGTQQANPAVKADRPEAPDPGPATTTQRTRRLVVILPRWDDSTEGFYAARILRELTAASAARDWSIEIRHPTDHLKLPASDELAYLAMDPDDNSIFRLNELAQHGAPVIATAPRSSLPFAANLCDDIRTAVHDGVTHLHQLGHRHIGGLIHDLNHNDYRQAITGFIEAHRDLNLSIHPKAIVQYFHNAQPTGSIDTDEITAWVTTFGSAANTVAAACLKAGLSIPDDVSIISLDDPGDHTSGPLGKRLTVVRADPARTAKTLWSCLEHWNDGLRGQVIMLPMQHIERDTVGPCPTR